MKRLTLLIAALGLPLGAAERPNILWITSEDNAWHWIGCYGNEDAKTPTIDKLAAEGVRFEHAYSNAPVCAVARSTLLMGAYAPTMGTQHMRSRHPVPSKFKPYVSYLREQGYYCTNNRKTDYNMQGDDKRHWDECSNEAHWKNRPEDAPFFAIFNLTVCHESSLFTQREMEPQRIDPEEIEVPPYLPDIPEMRVDLARYHDRITQMDQMVAARLAELEEAGLADDTIVFYYADHGGPTPRGKRYLEDTGVRVPMVVHLPEKWAHLSPFGTGEVSEELVAFVDLAPTVLSLVGLEKPAQMQGRAFLGEHREKPPEDDHVFLFADRFDELYGLRRAITDGRWKYLRRFSPQRPAAPYSFYQFSMPSWEAWREAWQAGELEGYVNDIWESPQEVECLFDTEADPWEVENLAGKPEHRERLEAMRQRLRARMSEVSDTGVIPEPMFDSLRGDETLHEFVRGDFDLEGALDLLFTATELEAGNFEALKGALDSDNPVTRYWAVMGLMLLGDEGKPAADAVAGLLDDPMSANRTLAAEALAGWGRRDAARESLIAQLERGGDEYEMLYVLNVIRRLDLIDALPEGWAEEQANNPKAGEYVKRFAKRAVQEGK